MLVHYTAYWADFVQRRNIRKQKEELERLMLKIPVVGDKLATTAERVKDSLKYLVVSGVFLKRWALNILDQSTAMILKRWKIH